LYTKNDSGEDGQPDAILPAHDIIISMIFDDIIVNKVIYFPIYFEF